MFPALALLTVYLVYPVFQSIRLSFMDANGQSFVGGANYDWLIHDGKFQESIVNNLMWLVFVPSAATFFGLVAAAVTDRIRWGNFAKAMIFMPMAISFVGGGGDLETGLRIPPRGAGADRHPERDLDRNGGRAADLAHLARGQFLPA